MAAPPRFPTLRETDLAIHDGPIDGAGLRDILKRLFAQLNPALDRTNSVTAKGVTLTENIRCDILGAQATHGVAFPVKLKTLTRANSCLVTGGDTLLPYPLASVQMLQPSQSGGQNTANVTVWFQGGTGTANVRLWLFDDGQQATQTLTFNTQPAWIAPTLLNGYSITGGGLMAPGYMQDSLGFIHLRGMVTNVAGVAGSTPIFTLPSGYRPSAELRFVSGTETGSGVALDILANGNVQCTTAVAANGTRSLDGISFDTRS